MLPYESIFCENKYRLLTIFMFLEGWCGGPGNLSHDVAVQFIHLLSHCEKVQSSKPPLLLKFYLSGVFHLELSFF